MRVSSVLIGLLAWTRFGASAIEEDAASFTEPALDSILLERAAASCGVSGYRRSTRPYLSRIFSYELSTAKLCGDRCWKESQCKSYSFGYGTCSLFKVEVSRNFKSNSRSPFKFYDKSCAKPAQPKCGLKGYDNKDKDTRFFTKTNCNLAACSALCKSKDRCKSMRHSGTTCNLYTAAISQSFTRDSRSAYTYYDRSCSISASPATGTSTTSRTSTTGTSTTQRSTTTSQSTTTRSSTTSQSTTTQTTTTTRTTTTTTTTSSQSTVTVSNVAIAFGIPAKTKHKRQTNGGSTMNYISREFSAVNGERSFTDDPAEALKVSFTVPQGDGVVRTGVNLLGDNQADYLDLRAVALIKNSESGSEQLLLGAAQPGLPPGDGKVNSINRKGGVTGFIAQSAIWTVNIRTFEMSAVWFNANGDKEDLSLMVASGGLFMTANPAAFPDAVTVQPVADVPDKVSACGNVNNYEYFNGACVEKCSSATVRQPNGSCKLLECPIGQMKKNGVCATCESIDLVYVPQSPYICDKACMTGYVRDPVSGVCGDGICPADQARTWENSVCQCRDLTKEKVGGTCMAKCNTALHEYRNATTKQCGCRSPDMSRSSPNSMCICAAGLEDDGWECVKECRADQFRARSGVCMCRDENAVEQNGACSTPTAPTGPAATCANAGLEYIPDAPEPCYEKCPSGQVRDPETYVCGVGLCPRPDQLRSKVTRQCVCRQSIKDIVNGVCVTNATRCIENGNEMINGDCKKKCQPALKEIRDAGTGECVCRADQSRQSLADPCKCPSGQEDDGSTCVVGSTTFSRIVFSFNIPSSMRKRQTTVDLSYGYISETMDGTGKRFLTGDVNNALKINFTLPTGTTKGEQLNFKGSGQPPEASSIPTLALILDMDNLNTGQAFGNYAHVLYFGTSRETAKGALPKEGIDNSMVFGRSREGQGKSFGPETAIWTIDTTTGFAEAYWIDKTGAKTKMIPCTSGTDLYFMPVGRTIGTELQFRAEIPGTPTPPPVGGPAECRTGTVGCPACPDRVNQCRSKEGFCVARDEVGACGYNCFPGNANAPPSADCWRCPNGYFGKSQSGCSPFPCPNPATEWRDRDGCHPNPGCTPPAVHNGYGSCVIYNTPVTVIEPTNPKVRSSTTTTTTTPVGPETPEPPAPTPFD